MTTRDLFFKEEERSLWRKLTARVIVTAKPVVNDQRGSPSAAVCTGSAFRRSPKVRIGKYVSSLQAGSGGRGDDAPGGSPEMCRKLLANHVIEDVRFQVEFETGERPSVHPAG